MSNVLVIVEMIPCERQRGKERGRNFLEGDTYEFNELYEFNVYLKGLRGFRVMVAWRGERLNGLGALVDLRGLTSWCLNVSEPQ